MNKVCDPEDSDSLDAKRYMTMLRESSKAMDRQLEEICKMEQENKGRKLDNHKANEKEGAANIFQDENGSKDGKISHNHRSLEEVDAKVGWSDPDDKSNEAQSDNGYKANESESDRDGDEGMEISDKE